MNPAGVLSDGIRPIAVLSSLGRQLGTFAALGATPEERVLARKAKRQADELRRTLQKLDV